MELLINGEKQYFEGVGTVAALVAHLKLDIRRVAIERNRQIVPRARHGEENLSAGDQIEIVQFIGGG